MSNPSGPRPLWLTAHAAVENGYDVTIRPRGSSIELFARRGSTEVVARWKRGDRYGQGDGEGRWKPEGRASVTNNGTEITDMWFGLAELRDWLAGDAS